MNDFKNLLYEAAQCPQCYFTHLQKSYNCGLDSIRLSPSCDTQRILSAMVQMSKTNTYTHYTHLHRKKDNIGNG